MTPHAQKERILQAVAFAKAILKEVRPQEISELAHATLLQGILSGDVTAAALAQRERLQRENLRLRQRLALSKLRTEATRRTLMEREIRTSSDLGNETINRIREIYGLAPVTTREHNNDKPQTPRPHTTNNNP